MSPSPSGTGHRTPDTGHRSLNPNVTPPGLRPGAREGEAAGEAMPLPRQRSVVGR